MFSTGRSVTRTAASFSARYSSNATSFDPRTPEFRKRFVQADHFQAQKKNLIKSFLYPNMSATEALRVLTVPMNWDKSVLGSWWQRQLIKNVKSTQAYNEKKIEDMGSEICLAHIILQLGGAVLFKGKSWMKWSLGLLDKIPKTFEEGWILEAIDLSDCEIYYEGFCSFRNLNNVHTIIAQNCQHLDDWCLDLLCSEVLGLETLDLSGCKNISPRGIVPLVRLPNLHTLDLSNCPAFETQEGKLMCVLIQDLKPNLNIKGVNLSESPITADKVQISEAGC